MIPPTAKMVFLSINRYERKKNLQLALEALAWLKNVVSETEWIGVHLVMAGEIKICCVLTQFLIPDTDLRW